MRDQFSNPFKTPDKIVGFFFIFVFDLYICQLLTGRHSGLNYHRHCLNLIRSCFLHACVFHSLCCAQICELWHIFQGFVSCLYVVTVSYKCLVCPALVHRPTSLLISYGYSVLVTPKVYKQGNHRVQQTEHWWPQLSFIGQLAVTQLAKTYPVVRQFRRPIAILKSYHWILFSSSLIHFISL
jgi:hypothetical protein